MTPGYVTHAGTFNGHLAAAVAGTDDAAAPGRGGDLAAERRRGGAGGPDRSRARRGRGAGRGHPGGLDHERAPGRAAGQLADLHLALLLNGVYTTPRA